MFRAFFYFIRNEISLHMQVCELDNNFRLTFKIHPERYIIKKQEIRNTNRTFIAL